jgi:hypothetical protein
MGRGLHAARSRYLYASWPDRGRILPVIVMPRLVRGIVLATCRRAVLAPGGPDEPGHDDFRELRSMTIFASFGP